MHAGAYYLLCIPKHGSSSHLKHLYSVQISIFVICNTYLNPQLNTGLQPCEWGILCTKSSQNVHKISWAQMELHPELPNMQSSKCPSGCSVWLFLCENLSHFLSHFFWMVNDVMIKNLINQFFDCQTLVCPTEMLYKHSCKRSSQNQPQPTGYLHNTYLISPAYHNSITLDRYEITLNINQINMIISSKQIEMTPKNHWP